MADIQLFLHMIKDSSVYAAAKPINPYYVGLNAFNQAVVTNQNNVQLSVPHFQPSQQGGQGIQSQAGGQQVATISQAQGGQGGSSSSHHHNQHHHHQQGQQQQIKNEPGEGGGHHHHTALASAPQTATLILSPEDDQILTGLKGKYGDLITKAIMDARNGDKDAFLKLVKFRRETILMKAKKTKSKDQSRWKTRYTCEEANCGHQVINNIQHFRRHVVKDHLNGLKIFSCTLCSKAFFTKYDLDIHYNRHLNGTAGVGGKGGASAAAGAAPNGTTAALVLAPAPGGQNGNVLTAAMSTITGDGNPSGGSVNNPGNNSIPTSSAGQGTSQLVALQQQQGGAGGQHHHQPIIAIPLYTDHNGQQIVGHPPGTVNGHPQQIPQYGMYTTTSKGPDGQQQQQLHQIQMFPMQQQQQQGGQGGQHSQQTVQTIGGLNQAQLVLTQPTGLQPAPGPSGGGGPPPTTGRKKKKGGAVNQDDVIWALKLKYGGIDIDNAIQAARSSDESVFMKFVPFKRTQLLSDKMKDGKYVQKTLYTCEELNCGHKVVNNIHHFRRHVIRDHLSGLKLFSCEFCNKTFHTKYDLGRHYIRHAKQGKQFPNLQEKIQMMIKRHH